MYNNAIGRVSGLNLSNTDPADRTPTSVFAPKHFLALDWLQWAASLPDPYGNARFAWLFGCLILSKHSSRFQVSLLSAIPFVHITVYWFPWYCIPSFLCDDCIRINVVFIRQFGLLWFTKDKPNTKKSSESGLECGPLRDQTAKIWGREQESLSESFWVPLVQLFKHQFYQCQPVMVSSNLWLTGGAGKGPYKTVRPYNLTTGFGTCSAAKDWRGLPQPCKDGEWAWKMPTLLCLAAKDGRQWQGDWGRADICDKLRWGLWRCRGDLAALHRGHRLLSSASWMVMAERRWLPAGREANESNWMSCFHWKEMCMRSTSLPLEVCSFPWDILR